jgi:HlyD family secretion protein
VVHTVNTTGVFLPQPTTKVFASMKGVVRFQNCEVGARVAKGQLCATVDQRLYRLAVERQRAQLNAAKAQLQKREAELARAKSTLERARASAKQSRINRATIAHERALAATKRSEDLTARRDAELSRAEADLARTEVRAPMDGTVISRGVETGQMAGAGTSMLFVIADRTIARIEVTAAPGDFDKVEVGDRAAIEIDDRPGHSLEGQVTAIGETQKIILSAPYAEGLLEPGRAASARIIIDERLDALRAPNEALLYSRSRNASQAVGKSERADAASLWVLRSGTPTPIPVRLGLDDGAYTEIVEGDIRPGDELIIGEKD